MRASEIRGKYLKFFEKRGHKKIKPAPLVLKDDPTTLFTSSGMQPLVSYLMGRSHPKGKRLTNSQPAIRLEDIEEVGDNRHTTFFEMLGNWSLGDYFKKEQLAWFWEFLTEELNLPKEKLYITIFDGNSGIAKDEESVDIWKKIGVSNSHIFYYKDNWWSRAGKTPDEMPVGEIGGPDSEVFFEFESVKHNLKYGKKCHPNCDCGRFLEIGNSVFMEYKKTEKGLEELSQKNVDFGGGLERLVAATNNEPDVFKIDLFGGAKKVLDEVDTANSEESQRAIRIILDHIRASMFLVDAGVVPSNKQQGYILRRLIRRAAVYSKVANIELDSNLSLLVRNFKKAYSGVYFKDETLQISGIIAGELNKFSKTLDRGLKEIVKLKSFSGKDLFDFYQTYGFPIEIMDELLKEKGITVDKEEFAKEFKKHQELSRKSSEKKFGIR